MSLLIFNLGPTEMIVILVIALLIFGGRLPDVARSLGRSFTQFKRGLRDVQDEVEEASQVDEPPRIQPPQQEPLPTKTPEQPAEIREPGSERNEN